MPDDFWKDAEVISAYTRAQAIEDGTLVDATLGEIADVTRQHFGPVHVAMTRSTYELILRAVYNERHGNDWRGVWHDVLTMASGAVRRSANRGGTAEPFRVIITGAGRGKYHTLWASVTGGDNGEPVVTILGEASEV